MNAVDLGTLEIKHDPLAERRAAERLELLRIAATRALELHSRIRHLDRDALRVARHWASMPALEGPLGSGAPA